MLVDRLMTANVPILLFLSYLQKAADTSIDQEALSAQLERLTAKANMAVTEQELRPLLEKMARKIDHKVWYVTEKGDLEVCM